MGTEHDWSRGSVEYIAWYELLPANSVQLTMTVSPGDVMSASITLQDATSHTWSLEITDTTNGQTFRQNFIYASSMLSGNWVVERPTVNNVEPLLTDFSRISFSDCSATLAGRTAGITGFPHSLVQLQGRMNNRLIAISDPTDNGAAFTVDFLSAR